MAGRQQRSAEDTEALQALLAGEQDRFNYDEITYPSLAIVKADSPMVIEGEPEYNAKAKPGHFFNKLTKRIYGLTVRFSVLRFFGSNYIQFDPKKLSVILDANVPPGDPRTQWKRNVEYTDPDTGETKTKDVAPAATKFMDYAIFLLDFPEDSPILWSASGSKAMRQARNMNGTAIQPIRESGIEVARPAPYARIFTLRSESRKKDGKILFDPIITPDGIHKETTIPELCRELIPKVKEIGESKVRDQKMIERRADDIEVDPDTGEVIGN